MKRFVLSLGLCLVAGAASGTTLISPLFHSTTNAVCNVTNVGTKPITVTFELVNIIGVPLIEPTVLTADPDVTTAAGAAYDGFVFCRATGKFPAKSARLTAMGFNNQTVEVTIAGF
jgi:hypothetical protein